MAVYPKVQAQSKSGDITGGDQRPLCRTFKIRTLFKASLVGFI
jgi:hypothetical protein